MSKYTVIKAEIRVNGANREYLHLTLSNENDIWGETINYVSHQERVIELYKTFNCEVSIMPEEFVTMYIDTVEWKSPVPFYKKHLVDHPQYGTKKGDLLRNNGIPTTFNSLVLHCRYYYDENGIKQYSKSEHPVEVGHRAMAKYCIPAVQTPITEASQTTTNTNRTANQQGSLRSIWYTVSCIYSQVHGTVTSCAQKQVKPQLPKNGER